VIVIQGLRKGQGQNSTVIQRDLPIARENLKNLASLDGTFYQTDVADRLMMHNDMIKETERTCVSLDCLGLRRDLWNTVDSPRDVFARS
jgi:hypothetical protein